MTAAATKEQSILRGLAVFGAVWQVLWLAAESGLASLVSGRPLSLATIALGVSLVAWLAVWFSLFGPWRSARSTQVLQVTIVVSVFVAGLALVVDPVALGPGGWRVGGSVVNLAVGLAGLYLPRRVGISVIVGIVAIETVGIVITHARDFTDGSLSVNLIYPVYALALGLASAAGRHAIVRWARREDADKATLARERMLREVTETTDASVSVAETRLHETVLNTLTAIVRGGLSKDDATAGRMRARAAEAADVLQRISQGADVSGDWSGDLSEDLSDTIADLRQRGTVVDLDGILAPGGPVAPSGEAYRAMGWALREALLNVQRHAHAERVRIFGELVREDRAPVWRVRVSDDGVGFAEEVLGFGLGSVIVDGLERVGGRAQIHSRPGAGTQIWLQVPTSASGSQTAPAGSTETVDGPFRAIGAPVLVAFSALTIFVIGATWEFAQVPEANLLAFVVFSAMTVVLGATMLTGTYMFAPWWAVVMVLVGVPVMTRLEFLAQATPIPLGDWSSEAGAALIFVVVATGAWWAGPLAIVSWVSSQERGLGELTQPGTVVVIVGAILGWWLRRADERSRRLRADADDERVGLQASRQRLSEVRRRYADLNAAGLVALLRGIAIGQIDPGDTSIREECARQERMIRSVLQLHPERNLMHRDLVHLAVIARDLDIDLSVKAGEDVPVDRGLRHLDAAVTLLTHGRRGTTARASTARSGVDCVFRLVVFVDADTLSDMPASTEILDEEQGLVSYEEVCIIDPNARISDYDTAEDARSGGSGGSG